MRKRQINPDEPSEGGKTNNAVSLIRGLAILRAFGPGDSTLGNQELMERTGLPKATISRLTQALSELDYLHYDSALGRYSIGSATISLGYSSLSAMPVVHMARPLLQRLADETGVAVALGTREGFEMLYLANCHGEGPVSLKLNVGSRTPILKSAMGLAYIAEMQSEPRDALLKKLIDREPEQESAIRALVEASLECYRRDGYVGAYGTWYSYINAVGTGFRPSDGSPIVALTCGGIVDILPRSLCETQIRECLLRTVADLKALLEGRQEAGTVIISGGNDAGGAGTAS